MGRHGRGHRPTHRDQHNPPAIGSSRSCRMTVRTAETISVEAPPAPGRVRAAVLTWSMGAVYSAITILVGFVTTPILLKLLTAERVGAARVVGEWMGYLMLADLGFM